MDSFYWKLTNLTLFNHPIYLIVTLCISITLFLVAANDQLNGGQNQYSSPTFKQGGGASNNNSNEDLTDNMILKNLEEDSDIEPYDQGEDDGEEDDPEVL